MYHIYLQFVTPRNAIVHCAETHKILGSIFMEAKGNTFIPIDGSAIYREQMEEINEVLKTDKFTFIEWSESYEGC